MAIVSSFGSVQALGAPSGPSWVSSGGSLSLYNATAQTYAALYATQPNVRTVVDFLARNIAQLGVHVYRRVSDDDRERLAGHPLAATLYNPNPGKTRYRFIEDLLGDMGIYFNGYWLKVRGDRLGLVRLPPDEMQVEGALMPTAFYWTPEQSGKTLAFAPSDIVHFNGYNPTPGRALVGLSPLETLRRILAEEAAAGEYRQGFWRNSGRIEGVITRPKDAPKWSVDQQNDFRAQWNAKFSGGMNAGKTAVLEDGMDFKPIAFSAKDSEFLAARKLTREECAAAYHVPLPLVGILEHATFSNVKEQHKHLYQDCLGPWLEMIAEEFERQLLPEFEDVRDVYVEFNIAEKLKGSFEEQAAALQTLVGRPVMTVNEGRARLNLPAQSDASANTVANPLNMSTGAAPALSPPADDATAVANDVTPVLTAWDARLTARLAKLPASGRVAAFDTARWASELATDLVPLVGEDQAVAIAGRVTFHKVLQLERDAAASQEIPA